jgi:hypothetical protein
MRKKRDKIVLMKLPKLEYFHYRYHREEEEAKGLGFEEIQDHPCFKALNETEQDIYMLYRMGNKGYEIAQKLELRPDQVCRKLAEIKARFEYLLRFREVLKNSRTARKKFFEAFVRGACEMLRGGK